MPRVLYIEDNADNRLLVKRILMAYDIDVRDVDNATEGIELAQQQTPDLILMDISMPVVDGLSATKTLRQMSQFDNVPVIALTANVRDGDQQMTLDAGCDGYIGKPIDVDKFPDQVLKYIRSGR